MTIASGIRTQLIYVAESTRGTTPGSPSCTVLRLNSYDINPVKAELRTEEMRTDRMVASLRHGQRSVTGTLNGELMLQNHDDWLEAGLGGAWDGTIAASENIGAVASGDQFSRSTGSFITDGFRPGDIITTASFSDGDNNGTFLVVAVAATTLDVINLDGTAAGLADEAVGAGPTMDLTGERVDVGTTLSTFTVERQFPDITQYQPFRGVAVNTMSFDLTPESLPTVSYGVIGMDFDAMNGSSIDSTPTAAPTNQPMAPIDGKLLWDSGQITIVTGLTLEVNNNRTLEAVIGATASPDVFEGESMINGEVSVFLEDATYVSLFEDESEALISVRLPDPDDSTAFLNLTLYRVKFGAANANPPRTGPVILTMPFEALRHATWENSFAIQKSNS